MTTVRPATQSDVKRALHMADAATDGPWENVRAAYEDCLVCDVDGVGHCINRDAEFIADSRTSVPAMAARIDELVVALRDIMYHTRGEHVTAHRIAYLAVGAYTTGGDA